MALSASTVFEVRTPADGGDDDNGGGFVTGASGTDYSQQAAAQLTLTDLAATTGGTTLTSATGGFTAEMIGNLIQIKSGTNFTAGWYQITAHTDTNTVTLDRDPTNGSNASAGTGSVGGALASPGQLGAALSVNRMRAWVRGGTYTLSSGSANVPGGTFSLLNRLSHVRGYEVTRGDDGTPPVLSAGAIDSVSLWTCSGSTAGATTYLFNLAADGNGRSSITGFNIQSRDASSRLLATDCATGFSGAVGNITDSMAVDCGTGFNNSARSLCVADGCTTGFVQGLGTGPTHCLAVNCGTGFSLNSRAWLANCIAALCSGDGFGGGHSGTCFKNCLAVSNGAYGFDGVTGTVLDGCVDYDNTSGRSRNIVFDINPVTLTADPFVDAAAGDFNINDTAGGGAVLRAVQLTL